MFTARASSKSPWRALALGLCLAMCSPWPSAWADQLVFGSFRSSDNAHNWAARLSRSFGLGMTVEQTAAETAEQGPQTAFYRVVSPVLQEDALAALSRRASAAGVRHWRLIRKAGQPITTEQSADTGPRSQQSTEPASDQAVDQPPGLASDSREELVEVTQASTPSSATPPRLTPPSPLVESQRDGDSSAAPAGNPDLTAQQHTARSAYDQSFEWALSGQSRYFPRAGTTDSTRAFASVSAELDFYRAWNADQDSITFKPFVRLATQGGRRSHGDIRELYYSRVGEDWDVHLGARRVFWGVTEFHHLIDIINQTDLVENFDTEDKLGQPMISASLIRDWGLLDVYLLTGFRERNFNGRSERLGFPWHLDNAQYESGAEDKRVDVALRWSQSLGPVELGLHHFSGTSREPLLLPGANTLLPYYPVIDQSGIDAQAVVGDWAFKLEGFSRSGYGDRYAAANVGFERTFFGIFDSSADFGLVVEYMYDERDEQAFNTLFEDDYAIGGRLLLNDLGDTQALVGVIVDAATDERVISVEASTRLSEAWSLSLEGRLFNGADRLPAGAVPALLLDPQFKSSWLQDEDYVQLEVTRYF